MSTKVKSLLMILAAGLVIVCGLLLWSSQPANNYKPDTLKKHAAESKPTVAITTPESARSVVKGTPLQASVETSGTQIVKVVYEIDGVFAGVSYDAPFGMSLDTASLGLGAHTLRVTAYNSKGTASSPQIITFTVVAAQDQSTAPPSVSDSRAQKTTTRPSPGASTSGNSSSSSSPGGSSAPDTTPPSSPSNVQLSDAGNYHVHISWTAATDNVAVSGYEVWRDNSLLATITDNSYTDNTTLPGHTYQYQIRALDAAGNRSALAPVVAIAFAQVKVFSDTDTPVTTSTNDSGSIELGMKFRATQNGIVTGVQFYKGAGNGGTHTGNLWTSSGTNLASVTFSGETASGWQTAIFSNPVHITAGTVYVASYFAPAGHYASTAKYFVVNHFSTPYITGLADGDSGGNGLFAYNATSTFPTGSFDTTNYWVDVLFTPDTAAAYQASRTCPAWPALPDSSCTGVPSGVNLTTHTGNLTIEVDNLTIDSYDIDGSLTIQADNVIVRNSRIRGIVNASAAGQTGLVVQDSELSPAAYTAGFQAPIGDGNYTLLRTHIRKWQDGPRSGLGTVIIRDSISDDLAFAVNEHPDGYQQFGPGNVAHVTLEHNILSGCAGNVSDPGNSAIFWADSPGGGSTLEAFHNSFRCGQYSVRVNDAGAGSNVTVNVHDNQIVRDSYARGPYECVNSIAYNGSEGLQWSNNTYDDGLPVIFGGCP
jgi:Domain of unknown function (DUF4082)/Bacterial Ig domain/Fibronectin type III domain